MDHALCEQQRKRGSRTIEKQYSGTMRLKRRRCEISPDGRSMQENGWYKTLREKYLETDRGDPVGVESAT